MKPLLAFLAILIISTSAAFAQSGTYIGTITVYADPKTGSSGTTSSEFTVFRTSGGQVQFSFNWSTFTVTSGNVNSATEAEIVDALADAAVAKGIADGWITSSDGNNTKVWSPTCLVRSGSGTSLTITPSTSCTTVAAQDYLLNWSATPVGVTQTAAWTASCCPLN